MTAWILALIVSIVGLIATGYWWGIRHRLRAESDIGVQSLAEMRWRDCISLIFKALKNEGYAEDPLAREPGEGTTEFLLLRDNQKVLLTFKHGTAYKISEAQIREFCTRLRLVDAGRGILLTLGSVDNQIRQRAKLSGVEVIDGAALWTKVRKFLPRDLLDRVQFRSAASIRKRVMLGSISSILLGGLALVFGGELIGHQTVMPDVSEIAPLKSQPVTPTTAAPLNFQLNEAARALDEIAKLSPADRAQRRAEIAKSMRSISGVLSAAWSTDSTLLISLAHSDGKDKALINEVCRNITRFEELRYTRIQLTPPLDSDYPVRWRQCPH